MKTILGFFMLGVTVLYFGVMFYFAPQIWALESQALRVGIVGGWIACMFFSVWLLKSRSDRLKDRGFLKTPSGKPRIWPKVPVTVYTARDLSEQWLAAVDYAIDHINSAVGFRLLWPAQKLIEGNDPTTPGFHTIKVRDDNGIDPEHGSTVFYPEETPIKSALITVPEQPKAGGLTEDQMRNLALHEFGHALGLDHDETTDSIMWPGLLERPAGLTARDRARLRETYRPRMG